MNKNIWILFVLSICWLGVFSCGSPNEEQKSRNEEVNYTNYVQDSLVFDYLPEVELLDFNDKTLELLVLDKQSGEVMVLNEVGQIISKFNPHVEGPSYVGNNDHGWVFYGNDGLVSLGNYYFYHLKKNGTMISRYKYPVEVQGIWSLDYLPEMLFSYSADEKNYLVPFITEPAGFPSNTQEFQDSINMLYRVNFDKNTSSPIMKKRPESIYRTLGAYVDRGWPYAVQVEGSKLAVMYSIDSLIYLYDAHTDELLQEIKIPEEYRAQFEPIAFEKKGKSDRTRINTQIYSTGNYLILTVTDRIPQSVLGPIERQGSGWWKSQEYKEAAKKYIRNNKLVFDLSGSYLGKLNSQIGLLGYDIESTNLGYYWVQRRYEDERDYKTFLKVGIKADQ